MYIFSTFTTSIISLPYSNGLKKPSLKHIKHIFVTLNHPLIINVPFFSSYIYGNQRGLTAHHWTFSPVKVTCGLCSGHDNNTSSSKHWLYQLHAQIKFYFHFELQWVDILAFFGFRLVPGKLRLKMTKTEL